MRRKTPSPIITKLNHAISDPDAASVKKKWEAFGIDPVATTPAELRKILAKEITDFTAAARRANISRKGRIAFEKLSVAVDIGGTFTDLLAFDADTGEIHQAKCLSTPPDFATGVLDGVHKATLDLNRSRASSMARRSPSTPRSNAPARARR